MSSLSSHAGNDGETAIPYFGVFDLFKIGIGPSSSHTMGPMTAALRFLDEVAAERESDDATSVVVRLSVALHGSLAFTGLGHGTDAAVILGLCGHRPDGIDPDAVSPMQLGLSEDGRALAIQLNTIQVVVP